MAGILQNIELLFTWLLNQITGALSALVANPYFLLAVLIAVVPVIIGIVFRVFRSFGLKRGGRRKR